MKSTSELVEPRPVERRYDVTRATFENEVRGANCPVILSGLVTNWPLVRRGQEAVDDLAEQLAGFDVGRPAEALFGPPEIEGRFFYSDDMRGLNFKRQPVPVGAAIKGVLAQSRAHSGGTVYLQSLPVIDHLPGLLEEVSMPLLDDAVTPRIWIGNRLTVQTHFDLQENIACCIAGRRRFTLFPPEQTPNLYPGPFEFTLSGPPVSMVRLHDPDLERFPRFREAMKHALVAELEPGDAIYVPYAWWHQVESLDAFNILMNYWWNPVGASTSSPFDALLHGMLALRDLPEAQRDVWKVLFDTYVFRQHGDATAHLPDHARGAHGTHSERQRRQLLDTLVKSLARQANNSVAEK